MDELRFCRECKRQVVRPVYFKSLIFCSKRCRTVNRPQKQQPPNPADPLDGLFGKARPTAEEAEVWSAYIWNAAKRIREAAEARWKANMAPDSPDDEKALRARLDAQRRLRRQPVDDEGASEEDD